MDNSSNHNAAHNSVSTDTATLVDHIPTQKSNWFIRQYERAAESCRDFRRPGRTWKGLGYGYLAALLIQIPPIFLIIAPELNDDHWLLRYAAGISTCVCFAAWCKTFILYGARQAGEMLAYWVGYVAVLVLFAVLRVQQKRAGISAPTTTASTTSPGW